MSKGELLIAEENLINKAKKYPVRERKIGEDNYTYITVNNPYPLSKSLHYLIGSLDPLRDTNLTLDEIIQRSRIYERRYIIFAGNRIRTDSEGNIHEFTGFEPYLRGLKPNDAALIIAQFGQKEIQLREYGWINRINHLDQLRLTELLELNAIMEKSIAYFNGNIMTNNAKKHRGERDNWFQYIHNHHPLSIKYDTKNGTQQYEIPIYEIFDPALEQPETNLMQEPENNAPFDLDYVLQYMKIKKPALKEGYELMKLVGAAGHPLVRQLAFEFNEAFKNLEHSY